MKLLSGWRWGTQEQGWLVMATLVTLLWGLATITLLVTPVEAGYEAQTIPTPATPTITVVPSPRPPQPTPFQTPPGGQAVGRNGGGYGCGEWTVSVPPNAVPDGSTLHCGSFNPAYAPPTITGHRLLKHTINVHLYNNLGEWITYFTPPLTICYRYTAADVTVAKGQATLLRIVTSPAPPFIGAWTVLPTTVTSPQICATTQHLTLFDAAVSDTSGGITIYIVQPGDTLFGIATRRFGITVAALMAANRLTSTLIFPGQRLIIPVTGNATATLPTTQTGGYCSGPLRTDPITTRTYVVERCDTLFRIALRAGVSLNALMIANGLTSSYIQIGQLLIIPGK